MVRFFLRFLYNWLLSCRKAYSSLALSIWIVFKILLDSVYVNGGWWYQDKLRVLGMNQSVGKQEKRCAVNGLFLGK
ncbi:hypothetical protein BS1321_01240 [Peribacillus simplex NBRC 15720 = DSM 1321]|uniref:Uncharacterized protein n=1 Tax=Peribacillus simplex NBRC 15720 = DSM 1321 TaxID=1349754 RepID=A0A223EBW5_9BACI|nr:hypothetical protein BS1321_01240 [Peribacillus simplex NBRC 15720 = DSM 1321]